MMEFVEYAKPASVRAGSPAATKKVGMLSILCSGAPLSVKRCRKLNCTVPGSITQLVNMLGDRSITEPGGVGAACAEAAAAVAAAMAASVPRVASAAAALGRRERST